MQLEGPSGRDARRGALSQGVAFVTSMFHSHLTKGCARVYDYTESWLSHDV